jgi:hypothetical protein
VKRILLSRAEAELNEAANFRHNHEGNVERPGFPCISVSPKTEPRRDRRRALQLWSGGS